jgi:hypothetical protein
MPLRFYGRTNANLIWAHRLAQRIRRRAHILWISLTSSFRSTEPFVRLKRNDARPSDRLSILGPSST